jgi:hypothetical protein
MWNMARGAVYSFKVPDSFGSCNLTISQRVYEYRVMGLEIEGGGSRGRIYFI